MAPLILESPNHGFMARICLTGQHKELIEPFNEFFGIQSDINLEVMSPGQSLHALTAKIVSQIESVIINIKPDAVVVQGDTTSAMACALASFYLQVPVVHIEAGLRTEFKNNPFPEEMNRRLIGQIATYHFPPTERSGKNLEIENITPSLVTGNTGIDALKISLDKINPNTIKNILPKLDTSKKIILTTVHRRENFEKLDDIFGALLEIIESNSDCEIVFPVHPNPIVLKKSKELLANCPRIHLIEPLDYPNLISVLNASYLILSDSGGLQEEAPYLKKPVLILRTSTERQEGVEMGVAKLVGNNKSEIVKNTLLLLTDENEYRSLQKNSSPYGDGHASEKILSYLSNYL